MSIQDIVIALIPYAAWLLGGFVVLCVLFGLMMATQHVKSLDDDEEHR